MRLRGIRVLKDARKVLRGMGEICRREGALTTAITDLRLAYQSAGVETMLWTRVARPATVQ